MFDTLRAVGFAAAAFGAICFPAFADPSQAFELEAPIQAANYTDHAAAETSISIDEGSTAEPMPTVQDPQLTTPVATHSVEPGGTGPPSAAACPGRGRRRRPAG